MNHGAAAMPLTIDVSSKKRKATDEDQPDFELSSLHSNKLCLPRSTGLDMNQQAEFHPLPPDVNNAILASLGYDPLVSMQHSPASSYGTDLPPMTPGSHGHQHKGSNGSDYFNQQGRYPDIEPYPSFGILGPQAGASSDSMDVDGGAQQPAHGPQCKSIPQLSVRHNGGTSSELWAMCRDCGACNKVQSDKPVSSLCYSP